MLVISWSRGKVSVGNPLLLDLRLYLEYFGQEVNARGLIWKNVAHVVIIKRTHGLGDREINNLCFRKNYLLCVGNRWHLFQWFVWGILSDYRQSRVGGLGGLGQTNRASYMPTEMDSPQNEILERDVVSWFHKSWESILKVCTFLNTFQW